MVWAKIAPVAVVQEGGGEKGEGGWWWPVNRMESQSQDSVKYTALQQTPPHHLKAENRLARA